MWNLTSTSQQNRKQENIVLTTTSISGEISCGYETHSKYSVVTWKGPWLRVQKLHRLWNHTQASSRRREKIIPCQANHLWGPQQWDERNKSRFTILGILYQLLQGQKEKMLTHIAFGQCNSCPSYRQLTSPRLWTLAPSSLNCATQLRNTF